MKIEGLTQRQADELLVKHGANILKEPETYGPIKILIDQLKSPLIFVLFIAVALSFSLGEYIDTVFIMIVILINTSLGFFQEYKAQNILKTLKKKVSKKIKVIRDSQTQVIDYTMLVPGDTILLHAGLKVPGDAIIIEESELLVDESILTGESHPVEKSVGDTQLRQEEIKGIHKVFMGSTVVEGYGYAKVYATSDKTQFGKIAESLEDKFDPPTPIRLELQRLSKLVILIVIFITGFVGILGILRNMPLDDVILTSVSLAVGIIPESLLIALTVTLALGMNRIMKKKAIVKNLPAAETLGSVDVLGIDKTGTLTEGKMSVVGSEYTDRERGLYALAICNNESNFIDHALGSYLNNEKGKGFIPDARSDRVRFYPFSSQTKYTGAFNGHELFAVGAPEIILSFCTNTDRDWQAIFSEQAKAGNRMIAIAARNTSENENIDRNSLKNMDFVGLVILQDPVRKSVVESLAKIISSGVEIKVITGDLKETSLKVLQTINFDLDENEIISGSQLRELTNSNMLDEAIRRCKLFYRTTPDQKLDIVKSLQKQGLSVGMMGDGVNDSPAIKHAEIGISVDNGTDLTKEIADVVLLDSNFSTIVASIEEGRNITKNLRKIFVKLLADSFTEAVLIVMSLLAGFPLPLLPLQILWINMIVNGISGLALSFEPSNPNLLSQKPKGKKSSALDPFLISAIIAISLVTDVVFFLLYAFMIGSNYDYEAARTVIFIGVALTSLLFIFPAKTIDTGIFKEPLFNNKVLNFTFLISLLLVIAPVYNPFLQNLLGTVELNAAEWFVIIVLCIFNLAAVEIFKPFLHKIRDRSNS